MRRSFILWLFSVVAMTLPVAVARADSTVDQNKATVRHFYDEVCNSKNPDLADKYFSADAIDHEVMPGQKDPVPALANFKGFLTQFIKGFPDLKIQVEDMVAEGDKVVARVRMTGTNTGEFNGAPATGKSIDVGFIDIIRLKDGKLTEHWGMFDDSALMQQLGLAPPPPAAAPAPNPGAAPK